MVQLSIIIPARNECIAIAATLHAIVTAIAKAGRPTGEVEVIVVDNASSDGTAEMVKPFELSAGVRTVHAAALGAARARNVGVRSASGRLLLFVDADTLVPATIVTRTFDLADDGGFYCGMFRIAPIKPTFRGRLWWAFWNGVRHLPLARAKALPALMFCTRDAFDKAGGFDEGVAIGEEWPILAGQYRRDRRRLVYDRTATGLTSGRRMELRSFGYTRLFVKYVFAILLRPCRVHYAEDIRELEVAAR